MFQKLLIELQSRNINWIGIARVAGLPRAMFSKHFNGHQVIATKNYVRIFHAILDVTGALVFDGRIWWLDDVEVLCWRALEGDSAGIMDAHDLSVYLGG